MTIRGIAKSLLEFVGGILEGMSGFRYVENKREFLRLVTYLENKGVPYEIVDRIKGKTDGGYMVERGCRLREKIVFTVEEAKKIIETSSPYVQS